MPPGRPGPEQTARELIDTRLVAAGWLVQNRDAMNLHAGRGVAVREFKLKEGHGFVDYLLFVDQRAVGVLEAKPEGHTLTGVEVQAAKYFTGLPDSLDPPITPLPFVYLSNGCEIVFSNLLDPEPRSRPIFNFHRPSTLAEWLGSESLDRWVTWQRAAERPRRGAGDYEHRPSTLRSRLRALSGLEGVDLWDNQLRAVRNLEESFAADRPRALIQMATGSGKTITAITSIYRLIKYGGARRVLFLVDRKNLGEQAEKEFAGFVTPDEKRKFTELYNVQRLTSGTIGSSAKVVISTIQRLYSMLTGQEVEEEVEEGSQFGPAGEELREPVPVAYNAAVPIEFFDVIFIDECHRSIYSLWRQVIEYFDAYLVGLTATPAKHTFGFFNKNLVMEYPHAQAVADGVNVDFEVYRISTRISEAGSRIEAGPGVTVGYRDRQTRQLRWDAPDEDIVYGSEELDRRVVAKDQIRTILTTFRDKLFTEIFPGRHHVPKTLIFAKDDSHAEDVVTIAREVFGKGNDFCQKITYKTTGRRPADLIQDFRNSYNPRIAVTVDMIATGTDIKPIEIVMFMRTVRSRIFFEQMKGRGVRVIDDNELRAVTDDAPAKDHFVIVDCVGVTESELADTQPLERHKGVPFKELLEHVAAGGAHPDYLSSLASRLSRLDRQCSDEQTARIVQATGGAPLADITRAIVRALDPDIHVEEARKCFDLPAAVEPTLEQVEAAGKALRKEAVKPLAANPGLRAILQETKREQEQLIDEVSLDEVTRADYSEDARNRARQLVGSFEAYLRENKDEIDALQFFYSQPYRRRLHYKDIKALAEAIKAPPRAWTPERLWRAYETLDRSRVHGAAGQRLLTDIVSLVRFALHRDEELIPYRDKVEERFRSWLAQQEQRGRRFTDDQRRWLVMIEEHIATSLELEMDDFDAVPFVQEGGLGKAMVVFGPELGKIVREMNEVLAA